MYRWSYALMRNRTAIGGTTFAQLKPYAHVPGLIVLSAGTHEDARITLFKVQTL
jgi:hypothetical protein